MRLRMEQDSSSPGSPSLALGTPPQNQMQIPAGGPVASAGSAGPTGPGGQEGGQIRPQPQHSMPNLGPDSPFTQEQMMLLRNQMMAFRALSRNQALPPSVQQALMNGQINIPTQQSPQDQQHQQQLLQKQQLQQQQQQSQQQFLPQQPQQPVPPQNLHSPQNHQKQLPLLSSGEEFQPHQGIQGTQGMPKRTSPGSRKKSGPNMPTPQQQRSYSRGSSVSSPASAVTAAQQRTSSPGTGGAPISAPVAPVSSSPISVPAPVAAPVSVPAAPPPPLPVSMQLFGASSYVDSRSESYLPSSVSFEDYTARQQQLFIPSIMPIGLDPIEMKLERERRIKHEIDARIAVLSRLEKEDAKNMSIDDKIELKSLKLLNYNKALRGDLLTNVYYFNSVALDESNKGRFTRMKKLTLQEANATEQFNYQQRIERQRRENQRKLDYINSMCKHSLDVVTAVNSKKTRQAKLGKSVVAFHNFTEREEQKRLERTAKQRLQALRANDEEAYIKLLDQTKDTRITHLLRQTNQFLKSLTKAVESQQREAKGHEMRGADNNIITGTGGPSLDEDDEDAENRDYYAVAHRVREEIHKQPNILVGGSLKEYQIKGLQWMVSLFNNNLNGILADEMGLGKTIQSISLITYLIETKKIPGPYIVIVPLSTLTNWNMEFEKWAPSVRKVVYKGPPMARKAQQAAIRSGDFQVLLTTYEYIIKDRPILSRIKWVHMIIDEGHRMKNTQSKLSSTLTQYYNTRYRLILTGTPLQNNLPELWALLNFVLPKIFNSVKSFDEWFNTPFANTGGQDKMDLSEEETLLIIRRLHKVLRPFLLRRLKKDVEKDLPDKVEKVIKCKMSALQAKLYQQMIKYKVLVLGEDAKGASSSGLKGLNNQIMQLRKICNHPFVFEEVENLVNPNKETNDDLFRAAGKFELLDRILPKFKVTGHRVLIFFQMTQIMDIMEDYLRLRGMSYLRLDGGTKAEDRSELLKQFNAPNSPYFAFLLSTRAGGLGLNLQTADTVIIYDTDWNPHQDLQAQDRAHRIGQTKEVRILRLITENSVEENILERAHRKLEIDGKVIQAGKFDNKSTSEEQEAFLRSLLEAEEAKRTLKEEDDEELDDEELNEVLARDDDERELFREIDRKRAAEYGKTGARSRLMTDEELPAVYSQDMVEMMRPEPMENYGRGTRERKVLYYDDGLTEEQWLEAVDNDEDTIEEAIARKRQRITKRKQNKNRKQFDGIDSPDTSSPGTPNTPMAVAASTPVPAAVHLSVSTPTSANGIVNGKRKRGRGRARKDSSLANSSGDISHVHISATTGGKTTAMATSATIKTNSVSASLSSSKSSAMAAIDSTAAKAAALLASTDDSSSGIVPPPRKRAKGRPPKAKETLSPEARKELTRQMEDIYSYITTNVKDTDGRNRIDLFLERPPKRIYPDYYVLIENPIACDIIRKRINDAWYQSLRQFREDFRLMFRNARTYNEEGSFVVQDANILEAAVNVKYYDYVPEAVLIDAELAKREREEKDKREQQQKEVQLQQTAPSRSSSSSPSYESLKKEINDNDTNRKSIFSEKDSLVRETFTEKVGNISSLSDMIDVNNDNNDEADQGSHSSGVDQNNIHKDGISRNLAEEEGRAKNIIKLPLMNDSAVKDDDDDISLDIDISVDGSINGRLDIDENSAIIDAPIGGNDEDDEENDDLIQDDDGLDLDPFGGEFPDYGHDFDDSGILDRLS